MANFFWDNLFRNDDQDQSVLEALRQTFIFNSLSKSELRFVKDTVHVRTFKAGESIFRQGEVGVGMYVLLSGSLDIFVDFFGGGGTSSPSGGGGGVGSGAGSGGGGTEAHPEHHTLVRTQIVTRLVAGDFLGELSLVEHNSRRTATAIAAEDSQLIGFFKPDLFEILDRQPATGVKILLRLSEVLGRRLKETTAKVSELKEEVRAASERERQ